MLQADFVSLQRRLLEHAQNGTTDQAETHAGGDLTTAGTVLSVALDCPVAFPLAVEYTATATELRTSHGGDPNEVAVFTLQ